MEENQKQPLSFHLKEFKKKMVSYLTSFNEAKNIPSTVGLSARALQRNSLQEELAYEYFDEETNLFFMDENNQMVVGFGLVFTPQLLQDDTLAESFNTLLLKMPVGAVVTTMIHSSPVVGYALDAWELSKNRRHSVMTTKLVEKRKQYYENAATGLSLTETSRLHTRTYKHILLIRIPFEGNAASETEINEYFNRIVELKNMAKGNLLSGNLYPDDLTPAFFHSFVWHLLNPQKVKKNQRFYLDEMLDSKLTPKNLVHKSTRTKVSTSSTLLFMDEGENIVDNADEIVEVVPMTVDEYPEMLFPQMAGSLIGSMIDKDARISAPFTLYTHIEIVNPDEAVKAVKFKKFLIQKQLVSESDFAKNNFADMFKRRDDSTIFINQSKGKYRPVRMMTGVNVYTTPKEKNLDTEEVEGVFKSQGYRLSVEPFIGLPIFLSSLPFMYDPKVDLPNAGLQRSQMVTSFNAACASHFTGEWKGTSTAITEREGEPPTGGGTLMVGPKGQLASLDLFNSNTNYNGIAVGTSGAGKSFWMAEIALDIFCRNGVVRIIDVGRSYYNLCENLGGQNVIFDLSNPISLNPFWGVRDKHTFDKLAEFWRDLLVAMAYPGQRESHSWEYRFIQHAINAAWREHGERLELSKIVTTMEALLQGDNFNQDPRGADVIYQLSPYADPNGNFHAWFSGECQLEMNNDFMVFELDELGSSPELKAIVLMMVTNQIERELYLSDRSRWRLTIIDEAYDLLRNPSVGQVIEYLFRKARKYKGSCIVGTQSFADLYYNESTKGVIANSAWKYILQQESASLKKAFDEEIIPRNEFMEKVVSGVKPGKDYGELFVKTPFEFSVLYRFITDPYSFLTFSSKDSARVQRIADEFKKEQPGISSNDALALAIEQMSDQILEEKYARQNQR